MKKSNRYLKVVEWSEEDRCFIGRIPGLALGGIHGRNEMKVHAQLCDVVDEWIEIHGKDGAAPPPATD